MREWLVELRNKKGLTQEDVAIKSDVARAYITQIETGDRRPSVQVAKRIAEAVGFEWTIFFETDSNKTLHK